jgi:hypothetical protein
VTNVAIEDAIWALQEHGADVAAQLDDQALADLRRMLAELPGPDQAGRDRAETLARIADLLVETLPRDHPVRRALVGGRMLAPAVLDWTAVSQSLLGLSALSRLAGDDTADAGVVADVAGRLLGADALSEAQVRELGLDPDDPGLVRLARADGRRQWPAFQFGPGGAVPAIVRTVNQLLGARTDPLGVADWWLSRNGWLGDPPSRLVGAIPDDHILQAAQAVTAEV